MSDWLLSPDRWLWRLLDRWEAQRRQGRWMRRLARQDARMDRHGE